MAGPYPYPESFPQQPFPPPGGGPAEPYPQTVPSAYPGMMPPPVQYPKRRRWRLILGALLAVLLVAALATAVVFATRGDDSQATGAAVTEQSASTAIQGYLDALAQGDDETIARHTLCGLFDSVEQRRSDMRLAGLASDAFRKQFSRAEVAAIDKIVPWSDYQTQVLFTMRVAPAAGSARGQQAPDEEEQAVAQLLTHGDDVFVCSYLLRSGGQY